MMGDWIFAWAFTLIIYLIVPDVQLGKVETLLALSVFMFTGLYIYSVIEKLVKRKNKKRDENIFDMSERRKVS